MIWTGRLDGEEPLYHRIFQRVAVESDYNSISPNDFVLHGFAVDEGVRRNKGRVGAKEAPDVIRRNISNFPVVDPKFLLKDFGNITCEDKDLERAQAELAEKIHISLGKGAKSVIFGGGHEVTYAHYTGVQRAFPKQKVGIVNFDAHFDNREIDPQVGPTSGTGFSQIAAEGIVNSLHIGIQRNSNTLKLFDTAHRTGMNYILAEEVFFENLPALYSKIEDFCTQTDILYVTICMDVFNASIAPGVSALSYNGLFADAALMHLLKKIMQNPKLKAMDVAEVNPTFDRDEMTARLAAALINEWFILPETAAE